MPIKFLDIDAVVRQWADRLYDKTASKKQARLREKERSRNEKYINVAIDWSDVKFRDETQWPKLSDDTEASPTRNAVVTPTALPAQTVASNVSVLFQTQFTNNTGFDQEYSIHTTKTTRSSCSTNVENGLTKGAELSVTMKTPCEIFEANAGYHRETSLTNSEGETFEEELSWGVDSTIKVKSKHVADAELVVIEKKKKGTFVIETKVSGTVYVNFTNIRDNNSHLKSVGGNIKKIVEDYVTRERTKGEALDFVKIEDDTVVILTQGTCKFQFGVKQEVIVNQKAYSGSP